MKQIPFPELDALESIIDALKDRANVEVVNNVVYQQHNFPLYCISFGSQQPDVPVLAFFGGVHGLEKIGSEILLAYLQTINGLLEWDAEFSARLAQSRLVFFPIVNPVGVFLGTRSNGNGVDLMRNSPIRCTGERSIYSGHRLSHHLPWYQGIPEQMEVEAEALCQVMREQVFSSRLAICVDLHSGFGIHDRLWFPYAYSKIPFPDVAEMFAWKRLFDRTYPNHFYRIEPMSQEYMIDGDLWDYLYLEHLQQREKSQLLIPLTLEMGSWLWLRKNPQHLFRRHGLFHPMLPHRRLRILRRHLILFDFLYRSLLTPHTWAYLDKQKKQQFHQEALQYWYAN